MPQRDAYVTDGREARPSFAASDLGHAGPAWYALRVRSNSEFRVRDRVEFLGFEGFLPSYREESRWSDRTKTVERVLFPGYVFARSPAGQISGVVWSCGAAEVLSFAGVPAPIPEREIEDLRRAIASASRIEPCAYVAGEAIEIQTGPLAGVKGVVTRTRGALRVVVAIELLRRAVRVEVDAADLRRQ